MDVRRKKAIKPVVLTFILVFISQILISQSIRPSEGTILSADDSIPLENVRITNRSSKDNVMGFPPNGLKSEIDDNI